MADWVHRRLVYTSGASRPVDTAVDTLLAGQGVCRDYAHLTVTLLRALEIPARLVAVYAPGLSPWTSTPSSRPMSTASGRWSTRRGWRPLARWCGSAPGGTPPTPLSSRSSAGSRSSTR
ncbi:transglutaminase-like domain-containing protein [Blastococcus brunescens]|uniref:transglutaminase-like domain-containing protein n=1 Tax=Blastococcus brunescens TaxID=1564165 RepID=UPI003BEF1E81